MSKQLFRAIILLLFFQLPIGCTYDDCGNLEERFFVVSAIAAEIERGVIEIRIHQTELAQQNNSKSISGNVLLACSPEPGTPNHKLTGIAIVGDEDVFIEGTNYTAGQDLSSLFNLWSRWESTKITTQEYVNSQDDSTWLFTRQGGFYLELKQSPDYSIDQHIKAFLSFDDGAVIESNAIWFEIGTD